MYKISLKAIPLLLDVSIYSGLLKVSNLKLAEQSFKIFNHLLLIICTCSFLFPYNKAVANPFRPDMTTDSFDLSMSHSECKAKATEVASFVLIKYVDEENDSIFRIRGRTSVSRVMLVCMKKNKGVHFVTIAASSSSNNEHTSLINRIVNFMKS